MKDTNIELTNDKEINSQLIVYFWWLVVLTFVSQLITFLTQYLAGVIDLTVLGILTLGAVNTLIIGGGVKLVQKQMASISDRYNNKVKEKEITDSRNLLLENENSTLKKQLNDRDGELIALKTNIEHL